METPDTEPPGPPRGVQIYDRPAGADRARWLVPVAVAIAMLLSIITSVLLYTWAA